MRRDEPLPDNDTNQTSGEQGACRIRRRRRRRRFLTMDVDGRLQTHPFQTGYRRFKRVMSKFLPHDPPAPLPPNSAESCEHAEDLLALPGRAAGEGKAPKWWVAEATAFNTTIFVGFLLIWLVNRQTHIKRTRGSKYEHRSKPLLNMEDFDIDDEEDDDSSVSSQDGEDQKDSNKYDASGNEQQTETRTQRPKPMVNRRRSYPMKNLMNLTTERDEDLDDQDSVDEEYAIKESEPTLPSFQGPSPPATVKSETRGLFGVMKRLKVFSYLREEAMALCLAHAEFVNIGKAGDSLFEAGEFDGSLYAVISGSVQCQFLDFTIPDDEPISEDEPFAPQKNEDGIESTKRVLCTSSKAGDVLTSLLAMIVGLIDVYHDGDEIPILNPAPSTTTTLFGAGIRAVATSNQTRLLRVPPSCFATVLKQFPSDAFRIIQTVLCRVQRIMIQTLVQTLGLRKELLVPPEPKPNERGWFGILSTNTEWTTLQRSMSKVDKSNLMGPTEDNANIRKESAAVIASQFDIPETDRKTESIKSLFAESQIIKLSQGEVLFEAGMAHDSFYLVLEGSVEEGIEIPGPVKNNMPVPSTFHRHATILPGSIVGDMLCLTGEMSLFTVRCDDKSGCTLISLPKSVFRALIIQHPRALVTSLRENMRKISPVVYLVNWTSEWMHVESAELITRRGSSCTSMFVVLNGRLRASYGKQPKMQSGGLSAASKSRRATSGSYRQYEEYGRGKVVGEVGCLSMSNWPCDVYAIRQSEVVKVPMRTLISIVSRFPAAGVHFARAIASHVRSIHNGHTQPGRQSLPQGMPDTDMRSRMTPNAMLSMPSYGLSLATVAVVPLTSNVDLSKFCSLLVSSFQELAPSKLMTKGSVREAIGERAYRTRDAVHNLKLTRFLADTEENNRVVVYQGDRTYTWWTKLCVMQADYILLVVDAENAPQNSVVEKCLEWAHKSMDVCIDLVVVGQADRCHHDPDNEDEYFYDDNEEEFNVSDQLNNWSEERKWVAGHHLVRAPFQLHEMDFRRMCRRISGLAIGLVLGGGGARGMAHLGVIRALKEAGVTIDMVGGTSQGAFCGALYARQPDDFNQLERACRDMATGMSSIKEKILDLTLPLTSIFSGVRFNRSIRKAFGKMRIQDLVLNFYCVTVDLQKQKQVVHTKGLLWKYVRASMSLTSYLPPVSEEGSLLVDGGYLNVVPADVMRETMGARWVISVDVSTEMGRDYHEYGTSLSGWWVLWNSWNPFVKTVKVPSMADLSEMLIWVSSEQHRKAVTLASDLHLTPPIQDVGTLEFDRFDEIVETGYQYAKPIVDKWVAENPWLVSRRRRGTKKLKQ